MDIEQQIRNLIQRQCNAMRGLVEPARGAVAQMKDAGLHEGALRLEVVLFELDAVYGDMKAISINNPIGVMEAIRKIEGPGR